MECECGSGRPVSAACTRCDAPLCEACGESVNGKRFCAGCAAFVADRPAARPTAAPPQAPAPSEPTTAAPEAGGLDDLYAGPLEEPVAEEAAGQNPPPPPPSGGETTAATSDDLYTPGQEPAAERDARATSAGGVEISGDGTGSTPRALVFAVIGGALGVMLWYFVGVGFERTFGLVAIVVGALAGIGALVGSGGGGQRAALVAASVGLAGMVLGDYLVLDELFRRDAQRFAAENAEYLAELEASARDGFSARDVRSLYEISLSEWRELSEGDKIDLRDSLVGELEELRAVQQGGSILSFGEFLDLELFRVKTLVILGIGVVAAWRTGLGAD